MPEIASLVICEKIIQDQLGKPTLISLFQKMQTVVQEGQLIPKETLAGTPWAVFCEWVFSGEEKIAHTTEPFEQVMETVYPDGEATAIRARLVLTELSEAPLGTRAIMNIFGMPVYQAGYVAINVWIEQAKNRVSEVKSAYIKIEHIPTAPEVHDGGSVVATFTPQANQ